MKTIFQKVRFCGLLLIGWSGLGMPPVPVLADGPTLKRLFPAGVGRDQTVEIAALGEAAKWPVQVWSDDVHVKWEPLADKGKFRVVADSEARLGVHHVRFSDSENATDALRYMVGPIAEKNEIEPNDDASEACKVTALPVVINGVLEKRGSVDTFEVELDQDQTLVAVVEANANLRSPVDITVQVLSSKGNVLAQNLDKVGLDPGVEFQSPRKARFLVRVFGFPETPDSTIGYAGGDNFVYRLTLTTSGWVRTMKPMAIHRTELNKLRLEGVNLPLAEVTPTLPEKFSGSSWTLFTAGLSHAPVLDVLDLPQAVEPLRPDSGQLPKLTIPGSMTGTISQHNERDFYSFDAKKDSKLSLALTSRRMGLPMDAVLRVLDLSGKQLAREDDTAKEEDAKLIFQAPVDGNYVLEVTDAFMAGGPEWVYRLDVQPPQSDVGLSLKADHFAGKVNEEIELAVTIDRRHGFDKPLMLSVSGFDSNVVSQPVKAEKDAKYVKLKLKATAALSGPFRVVAHQAEDQAWQRMATAASDPLLHDLWLTVK